MRNNGHRKNSITLTASKNIKFQHHKDIRQPYWWNDSAPTILSHQRFPIASQLSKRHQGWLVPRECYQLQNHHSLSAIVTLQIICISEWHMQSLHRSCGKWLKECFQSLLLFKATSGIIHTSANNKTAISKVWRHLGHWHQQNSSKAGKDCPKMSVANHEPITIRAIATLQ
jgi:hypothetical protein